MVYDLRILLNGIATSDVINNLKVSNVVGNSKTLAIGSTGSTHCTFYIDNPTESYENKVITIQRKARNSEEWFNIGVFKVTNVDIENSKCTYDCYDAMGYAFSDTYISDLLYPTTDILILNEVCSKCGVNVANTSDLTPHTIEKPIYEYQCREVIGFLASLQGANAFINSNGDLEIKWYENSSKTISDAEIYQDAITISNENDFVLEKLSCQVMTDSSVYTIEAGEGEQGISFKNPFMTQAILNEIYAKIGGFTVKGVDVRFIGDFELNILDILNIEQGETTIEVPVMELQYEIDGGVICNVIASVDSEAQYEANSQSNTSLNADRMYKRIVGNSERIVAISEDVYGLNIRVQNLESGTGGEIEMYYAPEVPTMENYPVNTWVVPIYPSDDLYPSEDLVWETSNEEYYKHLGALVYVEGTTDLYRFVVDDNNVYGFAKLENTEAGFILGQISALKVTTEGISTQVQATRLLLDKTIQENETRFDQTDEYIRTQVVKNGEVISSINQSQEGISIQADKINLEGTVTANENFKILEDGSMEAKDGKFSGDIHAVGGNIIIDYDEASQNAMEIGCSIGAGKKVVASVSPQDIRVGQYQYGFNEATGQEELAWNGGTIIDSNGINTPSLLVNGVNVISRIAGGRNTYHTGTRTATSGTTNLEVSANIAFKKGKRYLFLFYGIVKTSTNTSGICMRIGSTTLSDYPITNLTSFINLFGIASYTPTSDATQSVNMGLYAQSGATATLASYNRYGWVCIEFNT